MTSKQFIKKYIPKDKQVEAEDDLEGLIYETENRAFDDCRNELVSHLRNTINEIKYSW